MKFFSKNNQKSKSNRVNLNARRAGFTLVETLVAVAIFSVSIAAVISVVARGISSNTASKNRITANYLAQEGIEYMRQMRNKYTQAPNVSLNWSDFMGKVAPCDITTQGQNAKCAIEDPAILDPAQELFPCSNQRCDDRPIYLDRDLQGEVENGYYYQTQSGSPGSETAFRRYITVQTNPLDADQLKITTHVVWAEKNNAEKNVTLTETLTNWLPTP